MARSIRVILQPTPSPTGSGGSGRANLVSGVRLELSRLAGGGSQAVPDEELPAKLVFHVHLFNRVRTAEPEKKIQVATLEGQIILRGAQLTPIFVNARDEVDEPKR